MTRRTPALTSQVREMFEEELFNEGWQPGLTIPMIAEATGLTKEQVRDALFNEASDPWRRGLIDRAYRRAYPSE